MHSTVNSHMLLPERYSAGYLPYIMNRCYSCSADSC